MTDPQWTPGQRAVIDRREIVTIERVTRGGKAVVGSRQFRPNGSEVSSSLRSAQLDPLTPEIEAEMALAKKGSAATEKLRAVLNSAAQWCRSNMSHYNGWHYVCPTPADISRAERLTVAIQAILGEGCDGRATAKNQAHEQ